MIYTYTSFVVVVTFLTSLFTVILPFIIT